ncbi:acetyl/propionyl/methylcrotonyl-CoA carboxylase subunit alpha [Sphingomonas bacterium]|uniref:acetyl/propionyl/methylcrotonyl-CoA carboxylase subunit alpha n=1 Tax=Sphingomonas bacterium TaxID=1895847 RepID=UPI00262B86A8|nr:acetyl/propionyl/methylcrotonyl-CoA carboxylase subunit alpha [Sphingomonas bacterium]MDB5679811.1 methylcrotonoyl-CoA carboxylase [Sphingomonas bacterium]
MLNSLLIANRGEIACRIIRTARAMGVRTVAVYSDADANALHVRQADEAVHIGPSPARESYLVGDKIIAAAKQTGAEAIHPGYGFLSENADFAQAVKDAGLIWVGPNPDSIRAMGLKDAAKERMIAAGVPVTPGYLGADQSPERLQAEADAIGYPVLIKAVAGGGGKGMRRVDAAQQFADDLLSCKREAASSFGDDRVLIEKYILSPRHIEVQVFGDTHGNVVHLFERDCSLQRRHQKVIEEAPAPGMDEITRAAICDAAVRAAKAVDYVGAGTIEFIADASEGLRADRIWFMEMNTRLQVEHPVTEEITGQDLVEWQLRVASGETLPKRQDELEINGWAMEARLYAEDPATGFLPSTGRLDRYCLPDEEIRVESGVEEWSVISPFYDPMIAKLVVHAEDRDDAIAELSHALSGTAIWPVKSNAGFLFRLTTSAEFRSGDVTTGFIGDRGDALIPAQEPSVEMLGQAARHLVQAYSNRSHHSRDNELLEGFRLNSAKQTGLMLQSAGKNYWLDKVPDFGGDVFSSSAGPDNVLVTRDGQSFVIGLSRFQAGGAVAGDGAILSPMPGRIIAVEVADGEAVTKGQKLVTLEAMKMEHSLVAPFDGVVAELNAEAGGQVSEGTLLVRIEKAG